MAKPAKAKNFTLGTPYETILADLVSNGRFNTETEVVRAMHPYGRRLRNQNAGAKK